MGTFAHGEILRKLGVVRYQERIAGRGVALGSFPEMISSPCFGRRGAALFQRKRDRKLRSPRCELPCWRRSRSWLHLCDPIEYPVESFPRDEVSTQLSPS